MCSSQEIQTVMGIYNPSTGQIAQMQEGFRIQTLFKACDGSMHASQEEAEKRNRLADLRREFHRIYNELPTSNNAALDFLQREQQIRFDMITVLQNMSEFE